MRLTCLQHQLFFYVLENGGYARSLMKTALELGIDYDNAWHSLNRLERAGLATVKRCTGRPLEITVSPAQLEKFVQLARP